MAKGTGTWTGEALAPRLRLVVTRLARRLRQHGTAELLTPTQASLLATVERRGPISLGALAVAERVRPPTITTAVSRLEDQGLVRRVADPRDRRCVEVHITPEGRRVLARSRSRKDALVGEWLERLDARELAVVEEAVGILERLQAAEPPGRPARRGAGS